MQLLIKRAFACFPDAAGTLVKLGFPAGGAVITAGAAVITAGGAMITAEAAICTTGGAEITARGAVITAGAVICTTAGTISTAGGTVITGRGVICTTRGTISTAGGAMITGGGVICTARGPIFTVGGASLTTRGVGFTTAGAGVRAGEVGIAFRRFAFPRDILAQARVGAIAIDSGKVGLCDEEIIAPPQERLRIGVVECSTCNVISRSKSEFENSGQIAFVYDGLLKDIEDEVLRVFRVFLSCPQEYAYGSCLQSVSGQ